MREHKAFPLQVKEVDAEAGTFSGYAAVFGNRDSYGDVIEPGAFAKTVADKGGVFPVLWQHDSWEPIGVSTTMSEDDKGLYVEAEVSMEPSGKGPLAMDLLRRKAIRGLSIGFQVVQQSMDAGIRRLTEIKLWEFSVVTFPANELALVSGVKSERFAQAVARWAEQDPNGFRAATLALLDAEPPDGTPTKGAATTHPEPAFATPGAIVHHVFGGTSR